VWIPKKDIAEGWPQQCNSKERLPLEVMKWQCSFSIICTNLSSAWNVCAQFENKYTECGSCL